MVEETGDGWRTGSIVLVTLTSRPPPVETALRGNARGSRSLKVVPRRETTVHIGSASLPRTAMEPCIEEKSQGTDAPRHTNPIPGIVHVDVDAFFASVERSEERRVGKSVDLGGRRIIKK